MAILDHKRYIDRASNPAFSKRMTDLFNQGQIPPFVMVFSNSEEGFVTDYDKPGKDIIQFSFVITDGYDRVLPHFRAGYKNTNARSGHTVTDGCSVLVSWSPVATINGHPYPQSEEDVRHIFHREVRQRLGESAPTIHFLGLARHTVSLPVGGEAAYYFYLFEVKYSGSGPKGERLVKDKDDRFFDDFVPVDETLLTAIQEKKVDLRAIEAVSGRNLSSYNYGNCKLIQPVGNEIPPFLVRCPGVFISHSSVDKQIVYRLADCLEQAGIPTWVDQRRLNPGEVWFQRAFEAINCGPAFVVVCTEASFKSKPVRNELEQALQRRQWLEERGGRYEIFPIVIQGEKPETFIPEALKNYHGVDLRDTSNWAGGVSILINRLQQVLEHNRVAYQQTKRDRSCGSPTMVSTGTYFPFSSNWQS